MATFNLAAASQTTVTWSISALSNNFNQTFYQAAYLSTSPSPNSTTAPGGILSTITAPASGGTTSTGSTTTSGGGAFSAGNTYTLYGTVRSASGTYTNVGSLAVLMYPGSLLGKVYASKSTTYAPAVIDFSWDAILGATSYDYVTSTGSVGNTVGTSFSIGSKPAGTYSITVTPVNSSGSGSSGTASITITDPPRPSNFAWTNTKTAGADINVSASEWNSFCTRINDFRTYRGLSTTAFTTAVANVTDISATIYNAARSAISSMSPPTSLPAAVTGGSTTIAASHFNGLVSSLNSIA